MSELGSASCWEIGTGGRPGTSAVFTNRRTCYFGRSAEMTSQMTSRRWLPALLGMLGFSCDGLSRAGRAHPQSGGIKGNPADSRMRAASKRRGIEITSISRPIRPSDFREFDLILAMDRQNREDILKTFERWRHREAFPVDADKKVELMCSYCKRHDETEVPDPYYGGQQGFEKVLDLLEDACESLLDKIVAKGRQV